MYLAICTTGLEAQSALAAFESLEHAARCAILNAGGCLSHHHGVPGRILNYSCIVLILGLCVFFPLSNG